MLNKLTATVLFVHDLERCMTFYQDMFGLEALFTDDVSAAYSMDGHDFVLLQITAAIEMVGEEALVLDKSARNGVLLCIEVADVDESYKTLTARGLTFIKPPKSQAWGRRTAYFGDPEGNLWELWHPLSDET